jgi:hypothetical protein
MLVAELTIQTLPGRAPSVESQLGRIPGMSRLRLDGDQRVHATLRVAVDAVLLIGGHRR